jgi:hypothetical protein
LKQKSFPLPDPAWHADFVKLLKKECGVLWENVTEILYSQEELNGYNGVLHLEIEHRFGRGILGRLHTQAEADYRKSIGK